MDDTELASALAALGQRRRLQILRLLQVHEQGLSVNHIAESLGIRQNSVSVHLSILARNDLVVGHRMGKQVIYRCLPGAMKRISSRIAKDFGKHKL